MEPKWCSKRTSASAFAHQNNVIETDNAEKRVGDDEYLVIPSSCFTQFASSKIHVSHSLQVCERSDRLQHSAQRAIQTHENVQISVMLDRQGCNTDPHSVHPSLTIELSDRQSMVVPAVSTTPSSEEAVLSRVDEPLMVKWSKQVPPEEHDSMLYEPLTVRNPGRSTSMVQRSLLA